MMSLNPCAGLSRLLLTCAIATVLAAAAQADVTVEEKISLNGLGMMKLANMSGTTTTTIAGSRARTDSNLQFESGLLRTFARGVGQSTEIVRLDEDKIFSLDTKKKTYTETTFADMRAQMQQAMQKMDESQAAQQQQTSGVDESQCEWSEAKAEVKQTGEKAVIAGYQAERITIVATQSCKDKETGQVCDFGLVLDQYVAPDFEQTAEAMAYYRAYAEKMGFDAAASRDFSERAKSMFGRYKGIWTEVAEKMKDVKGYPVKSSFGLGVGGPQCQSTQQQQPQEAESESQSPPTSLGGAIGGALGGMFKKKKDPEPAAAAPAPQSMPGGLMPLMTIGTELVSVNRTSVPATTFEVPSDYKKKSAD
jgi:hypothetical protein